METEQVKRPLHELYSVCKRYMDTAKSGADIRNYGLTPELLDRCQAALAQFSTGTGAHQPEKHQEVLPNDLRHDGWELFATGSGRWFAQHAAFNRRTGEYPTVEEVVTEARVVARPY